MTVRAYLRVAQAIADGCTTNSAICEATGLDQPTVTNAIVTLRRGTQSRGNAITSTGRGGHATEAKYALTRDGMEMVASAGASKLPAAGVKGVPLLERVWPMPVRREERA